MFRWWARRPHSLVSALLEKSGLRRGGLVSDPFSGGGTVTLEAVKLGLDVYAQDLNPWPVWGLKSALDNVDSVELRTGVEKFLTRLRSKVARAYRTQCATHGKGEVLNTFWVRECICAKCRRSFYLFPYSLVTLASRRLGEQRGFYGCEKCGRVSRCKLNAIRPRCANCGHSFPDGRKPLFDEKKLICPHCQEDNTRCWLKRPKWKAVLLQRLCQVGNKECLHFDTRIDRQDIGARRNRTLPSPLRRAIPAGRETDVLKRAGFKQWAHLYPPRQLRALLKAAELARDVDVAPTIRNRLYLTLAGASEMAGFLCRWDRFHPKSFEALANHRFSVTGLAVEPNLFSSRGRGTIERRLRSSIRAAEWHEMVCKEGALRPSTLIVCGSSERQRLGDGVARLVLTDPPYFDAVQYGELSGLLLAWSEAVTDRCRKWRANLRLEAVPNPARLIGPAQHGRILTRIFKETARTLSPYGVLILTYHSTNFLGWAAVGRALHDSGFHIVGLATAHSENEKDHAKRGRRSFKCDLVIECRKRSSGQNAMVFTNSRTSEQRELVAAGVAIATWGGNEYEELATKFLKLRRRLRTRRIHVPRISS